MPEPDRKQLQFAMQLSLLTGVFMLIIKIAAYSLTGSTAILSDAAESIVHVVAVSFAAYSLRLSYKPADSSHLFGHAKVSYFSSGFEGAMIIFAAIYIIFTAISRWLHGLELENLDFGTGLTVLAVIINGVLGYYLLRMGKRRKSVILEANGKHVLTDSWTSFGVVIGLTLTWTTGWLPWDPIFAIITAANILVSGFGLIKNSVGGLMDKADPEVANKLRSLLEHEAEEYAIKYHNVRHRNLGNRLAIEFHLLFPAKTSVQEAHRTATKIEHAIENAFSPQPYVTTHLEALEDHSETHAHKPH